MSRLTLCYVIMCMVVLLCGLFASTATYGKSSEYGCDKYYKWMRSCFSDVRKDIPKITKSAEAAASLFVKDGYEVGVYGDPAFCEEYTGRAGGLVPMRKIRSGDDKPSKTIILASPRENHLESDIAELQGFQKQGNIIIVFARSSVLGAVKKSGMKCDAAINTHAAENGGLFKADNGTYSVPTDPVASITAMWVWTGEFVSACTRLGKMPTLWQSLSMPGSFERAEKYRNIKFHDGTPTPVAAGQAGNQYLSEMGDLLSKIYKQERPDIREIAMYAANARKNGGRFYVFALGHSLSDHREGYLYDPGYFTLINENWNHPKKDIVLGPKDIVLCLGYDGTIDPVFFGKFPEQARLAGAKLGWSITTYREDQVKAIPQDERIIEQYWKLGDAVVDFPGYEVKALPPSGVIGESILWMINAEIHDWQIHQH